MKLFLEVLLFFLIHLLWWTTLKNYKRHRICVSVKLKCIKFVTLIQLHERLKSFLTEGIQIMVGILYEERSTFDVHSCIKGGDEKSDNLNFRETK